MLVTETFHGYIETTQDVLLIFEGCRRGLLPRICRRLQERERKMIRSGSIFVFDERESGIKRWTDGRVWSPSRILGNFLIYRELDKKSNDSKKMSISSTSSNEPNTPIITAAGGSKRSFSIDSSASMDKSKERQLVGSLSDSYRFKEDGLIKKTMSIIVNGVAQHLISYYDPNEVVQEKLRAPSSVPELASLEISPELLIKQNFRIPPLVEPTFDNHGHQQHHGGHITPPESSTSRMMHPLRSMSVGSIRGIQQQQDMHHHLVYSSSTTLNNSNSRAHSPTTNFTIPNNVYNTTTNTNNTTNMPSPSSLSSSPSTPMLNYSNTNARQSYNQQAAQHQRHYSASSISSTSLPRFDPRNFSESSNDNNERFASPPNLGQLLNPIHPLNNAAANNNSNSGDLFGGITSHHPQAGGYNDYSTTNSNNGSSSLRNSISSQHEDNNTPTPTTSTSHPRQGSTASGGNSSGGGMGDYMHYYQRQQPLANTHHHHHQHVMFSADNHNEQQLSSFMNGTNNNLVGGSSSPDHQNADLEHFMLK